MKDLLKYLNKYKDFFQSECGDFNKTDGCKNKNGCSCKILAEVWAYTRAIVPEEFVDFSIYDFEGATSLDSNVLDAIGQQEKDNIDIMAGKAKDRIWEYCWKKPFVDSLTPQQMDAISVIDKRFDAGTNIIIHGTHYHDDYDPVSKKSKRFALKKGKSMLAAIVLKEAIRRKMFVSSKANTFEYVSYPLFRGDLLDYSNKDKKSRISDLEEVDWLVIDDVCIEEGHTRSDFNSYMKRQLDSFLMARIDASKPTIFVMQFNINDCDIRSELGFVMEKIAGSNNTFIVQV